MQAQRYGCSVRIAQVRHAARGRLRGGELWCQRLNRLLRHREVPRHDRAQAPLLLQREVCAVKTFATAPLHASQLGVRLPQRYDKRAFIDRFLVRKEFLALLLLQSEVQ